MAGRFQATRSTRVKVLCRPSFTVAEGKKVGSPVEGGVEARTWEAMNYKFEVAWGLPLG